MMDSIQEPTNISNDISSQEYKIPTWAKIVFRLYALFFISGTTLTGIMLADTALTQGGEILQITLGSPASTPGIITLSLLIFGLVALVLQISYGIGILRLRRWTLPLILIFSFGTVSIGLLNLFNPDSPKAFELIGLLGGVVFMGFVGFLSIKYWNYFSGSARKLLVQVPLLLIVLPFIIFSVLTQVFTDDSVIKDSDLVLPRAEIVNQSDNAFYTLSGIENLSSSQQAAFDEVRDYYSSLAQGEDINISETSSTLAVLANVTDAFIEASKKPDYQCPSLANKYGADIILCPLNILRSIAEVVAVRSYVEARQGNTEAALETALAPARLGKIIDSGQPILIEHLVGIALTRIGMESVDRVLDNSTTTKNAALRVFQELNRYQFDGSELAVSLRREYMSMKETLSPFAEFSNYFYQPNKTMNGLSALTRRNIEIARTPCGADLERKKQELDALVQSDRNLSWWLVLEPNGIGKVLESVIVGASFSTAREKECGINQIDTNVQNRLETISTR